MLGVVRTSCRKLTPSPATERGFLRSEATMLAILFFVVIFLLLGVYIWRDHHKAQAARDMAKLDAAVKAQAEQLAKKIP